jgi:hypothetical protein
MVQAIMQSLDISLRLIGSVRHVRHASGRMSDLENSVQTPQFVPVSRTVNLAPRCRAMRGEKGGNMGYKV